MTLFLNPLMLNEVLFLKGCSTDEPAALTAVRRINAEHPGKCSQQRYPTVVNGRDTRKREALGWSKSAGDYRNETGYKAVLPFKVKEQTLFEREKVMFYV